VKFKLLIQSELPLRLTRRTAASEVQVKPVQSARLKSTNWVESGTLNALTTGLNLTQLVSECFSNSEHFK